MWRIVLLCGCGVVQFGVTCGNIVRRCSAMVMVVWYGVVVTVVVGCVGCGVVRRRIAVVVWCSLVVI